MKTWYQYHIAVLLPCDNEAAGIAEVVPAFKEAPPTKTTTMSSDDNGECAIWAMVLVDPDGKVLLSAPELPVLVQKIEELL